MSSAPSFKRRIGIMLLGGALLIGSGCGSSGSRTDGPASTPAPDFVNAALQAYVKASNTDTSAFGFRLVLSGDTLAAVGADGEANSGAVYVFTRTAGVWSQQAYLKASNTSGRFASVALSGDTLAVGADGEASCATGVNGDQANDGCPGAGAVYVFTRTAGVWSQQAYVKASNTGAEDGFGNLVALSGNTLAVGASGEASCATGVNGDQANDGCFAAGAVYVFTRTAGVWSQQAYLKASNTAGGFANVAVSGNTLAVGASGEASCATGVNGDQANDGCPGAGAVHVFTRTAGVWSHQAYVKASNPEISDGFGFVALSGNTLAVGAQLEDSQATEINGNQADNTAPDSGAVYVLTRTGGVWSQQAYAKASNTGAEDWFGIGLAISADTLAVGAIREASCARGINGDQENNGCLVAGAVYVYVAPKGVRSGA